MFLSNLVNDEDVFVRPIKYDAVKYCVVSVSLMNNDDVSMKLVNDDDVSAFRKLVKDDNVFASFTLVSDGNISLSLENYDDVSAGVSRRRIRTMFFQG